jgi:membrane-bound lytic murein transglycosylase D
MKRNLLGIMTVFALVGSTASSVAQSIEDGIKNLPCIARTSNVDHSSIAKRVSVYLKGKKETERIIGRSAIFFPVIEQYLKEYKLPDDLKYVTVLETELNNADVSHSGASGVWQLMPDVKEEFGLRVDGVVDERYDVYKATEAALKDLKRLYNAFNEWEMALAGYNCGVGKLRGAIQKARSREFDKVKAFLPEEAQNYIPKFIAFTYLMKNYKNHGLKPSLPELDLQLLTRTKVTNYISLQTIADVTGMPLEAVKQLNPHFGNGYIPDDPKGNNVVLPRRVLNAFNDYIAHPDGSKSTCLNFSPIVMNDMPGLHDDPNYIKTSYTVADGEHIEMLAEIFNCTPYNIRMWNGIEEDYVYIGQELTMYLPKVIPKRV